ncbi:MAG: hypothetical protein HKN94_14285 [Acidimicrobiales bacterium]|nr:hypothetical protein [Acidimicrobiales bacterium]RZV44544.1 MAG: hypothetical protein EX269_11595 [Acidimicrobiales bacterium]
MPRSHRLARELRGTLLVVFVSLLVVWLFAKINDDRAEAKARTAAAAPVTTVATTTTTTTEPPVDDHLRLCSIAASFRGDLQSISVQLVDTSGNVLSNPGDRPIDLGLHADGDLQTEVNAAGEVVEPFGIPAPRITNPSRIDPLESGLLGAPQRLALKFYVAASSLSLGLVDADFDGAATYFTDLIAVGEPNGWSYEEIAASSVQDRWQSLVSRPSGTIPTTLTYIEDVCSLRIGTGFVYREKAAELAELEEILVPGDIDPSLLPPPTTVPPPADG